MIAPSQRIAISICFVFAVETAGCTHWKELPRPQDEATTNWEGRQVRLRRGDVERVVDVKKLTYPELEGSEIDAHGNAHPVVLDLRGFDQLEVLEVDGTRTLLLVGGIVGAALIFVLVKFYSALHSQ